MQNKFNHIINTFVTLSKSELKAFNKILIPVDFKKNDFFLKQGQLVNQIAFITDGVFEMYKTDKEGNEISLDFIFPDSFATDYVSYLTHSTCEVGIRANKQSSALVFNRKDLDILLESSLQFQKLGRILSEQSFIGFAERIREGFLSPEERYQKILKEKPNWIQNIPQYKIASYLNISAEWLSKIRAKN